MRRDGAPAAAAKYGPGECRRKEQQRGDAGQEQQEIAQALAPRLFERRAAQQPDGGERHFRRDVAPQQVQRDRDGNGHRAGEEDRIQERHGGLLPALACRQVGEQREVERLRGVELHVVDARAAQLAVVAQRQAGELAQVGRAHGAGVREELLGALDVAESRRAP